MSQRSPKIAAVAEGHEEIFLARYERLRGWALRLTEGDRGRAEDLVHDAFVHFTGTRPDLARIENLDGYLFVMLRNLHTSQLRRAARLRDRAMSILEYDSAEMGLRAVDPRELIRVQDELRACCRYACARKGSSKSGSVLALRFFHGYYPREIASVARATREAVEERLRAARSEARQFLKDPASLRFMHEADARGVAFAPTGFAQTTDELLADLRRAVFDSRTGLCPTGEELERLYRDVEARGGIDTKTLAHLVSCPRCMDEVNRLLDLPTLSERHPTDAAGVDARPKDEGDGGGDSGGDGGGGGGHDGGASAGGATQEDVRLCRRRARDLFEHRPGELCVAVNGRVLAAQKTGASRCEQTLSITLAETVEFVEVFSEQEVRLLFLDVNEHLTRSPEKYRASVALSDERTLEATLSFDEPWPTVQIVYEDPTPSPLVATQAHEAPAGGVGHALRGAVVPPTTEPSEQRAGEETASAGRPPRARKLSGLLSKASGWFVNSKFMLRPATVTAALAVLVVAALLLTRLHVPSVSAAELINRSAGAEEKLAADAGLVLHRTFYLEESTGGSAPVSRRRVEVWQSAARGLKLRRVYDRENKLVAGEWEAADGARTVYARGTAPRAEHAAPNLKALLDAGEVWRLDLSARTFGALVGDVEAATVEDELGAYVISYAASGPGEQGSLSSATVRLSKADLRATGQTLVVRVGGAKREYRFVESGFEKIPNERVAPNVFEPEPELLGSRAGASNRGASGETQGGAASSSFNGGAGAASPAVASQELEVEVAYLLNRIKADLGEQVTWTRTTGGQLRVEALAETEGRKEEILRALGPVLRNPAVVVDVSTVEERLRGGHLTRGGGESVREVEVSAGLMPADPELRRHFSARIAGDERLDEEIKRFAARALNRSRRAVLHASALKRLVARFTPAEARALAPEAREKWLAMMREHAQAARRETRALDGELRPVFPPGASEAGARRVDESDAAQAAARLLQLAYANDEAVRAAFTVSAEGGGTARVKSTQFWRSLRAAEELAGAILEAYEK